MKNKDLNNDTFLAKWLEGEITDNDLKSKVGEKEFQVYAKIKKSLEIKEQLDLPVGDSFQSIKSKLKPKKQKVISLYVTRIASIAAILLIAFGLLKFFGNSDTKISTEFGQQQTIVLLDGSEVVLNSKSELAYNEESWNENRTLFLDGEAYFKVAKGRTFTVETTNGSVQVLGTEFNVNSTKDYFDVVCYEGKVEVEAKDEKAQILTPQKSFRRINGLNPTLKNIEDIAPSWINGETTFRSTPLYVVLISLEKQYGLEIEAESVDLSKQFTGAFPNNDLETALKIVFTPLNIDYEILDKSNIKLKNSK